MAGIGDSVEVTISVSNPGPTGENFGVPMIVGTTNRGGAVVQAFPNPEAMVTAGFAVTDPEYLSASAMFAQDPCPPIVKIGRRALLPTKKILLTFPNAAVGKIYAGSIEGQNWSFTDAAGTAAAAATGVAAAITAALVLAPGGGMGEAATVTGGNTVVITGAAAGKLWSFGIANVQQATYEAQTTHVDPGIATDLAAIQLYDGIGSTYGYRVLGVSTAEIIAAAAWFEANGPDLAIFEDLHTRAINVTNTTGQDDGTHAGGSGNDSAAAQLKNAGYTRSAIMYTPGGLGDIAGAWMSTSFTKVAGSETWKFAQLAGVSAYVLTATQENNLKAKNANDYTLVGGWNITAEGKVAVGEFIDVVRGIDAMTADMTAQILAAFVSATAQGKKIPFTDKGITRIENIVRSVLGDYTDENVGLLADNPAPTVSAPLASSIPNKGNRQLTGVTFSGQLAEAIHFADVSGAVTA